MTRLLPVLIAVTLVIALLVLRHEHHSLAAGVPGRSTAATVRVAGEPRSVTTRRSAVPSRTSRHPHHLPLIWRKLAFCESTNRWGLVDPPYSGGLQFKASTWRSFDVQHYAPTAADATPWQQVQVARHVQRVQGWAAWPVCSVKVGLR